MQNSIDFLTIREILKGYKKKEFSSKEIFEYYFNRIKKYDSSLNTFVTKLSKEDIVKKIASKPTVIPIAHKDIYSTKDIETTAASNILRGYIPPYSATSVERLEAAGFIPIGKLNCDAFAHGATGENSEFGPTKNPYNQEYTPGGSSSGSAAVVAAGFSPVTTGTDTGGSIRLPASFTNTVGIKPTYGRVSRYGIIAMTSSTDSIGHITKTVWDNAYILNITAGYDPKDATSSQKSKDNYLEGIAQEIKGLKLGVPKEYVDDLAKEIKEKFKAALKVFSELGAEIIENISLPHTEYAIYTYYIITPSEISSNLARFDGIRFGHDRSKFGAEAKRRIMLGTFCLSSGYYDAYYKKAQKVRTLIIQDFQKAFQKVDALIVPVSPTYPPKLGEVIDDPIANYMMDVLTVPVNLAGVPALAIPAGFENGLPFGIQIIGDYFEEKLLYRIGYAFEQETEFYKQTPIL